MIIVGGRAIHPRERSVYCFGAVMASYDIEFSEHVAEASRRPVIDRLYTGDVDIATVKNVLRLDN